MKQAKYYWARYNNDAAKDANHEKLQDLNDWFIVEKITCVVGTYYRTMEGKEYWVNVHTDLVDNRIEISDFDIQRPYKEEEMHYLHEQEEELKKLFNIQD